jgi:hypothetical protein
MFDHSSPTVTVLKYAISQMLKNPGFTAVAALTLHSWSTMLCDSFYDTNRLAEIARKTTIPIARGRVE